MRIFTLPMVLLVALAAPLADASIAVGPAVRYERLSAIDNGTGIRSDSEFSSMTIDLKGGYLSDGAGWYLGALYRMESDSDSITNFKLSGSAFGPSVGFMNPKAGFSVVASYLFSATRTYSSGSVESKLSSGSGYQVDLAYAPTISGNWGVGPQITYRSVKFAKSKAGSAAESSNSYEETTIQPAIVLWMFF